MYNGERVYNAFVERFSLSNLRGFLTGRADELGSLRESSSALHCNSSGGARTD
jgi:hypothetical protein